MSRDGSFRSKVNGSVGDVTPRNTLFIRRLNHPLIRSPLIRSQLPTNGTSKKTRDKTLVGQGTIGSLRKGCHHRIGYLQRDPTSAGGFGGGWVAGKENGQFFLGGKVSVGMNFPHTIGGPKNYRYEMGIRTPFLVG